MDARERNRTILAMREKGADFTEIGEATGLSRSRAWQIYKKHERGIKLID